VKFAILGSGFGLYGYLPALVNGCGQTVVLPERYRARLREREDVRCFEHIVEWKTDDRAALKNVDAVIISQRPADQANRIRECVGYSNIRLLLLEKPLAPSPKAAFDILNVLEVSGKKYRIDYNFRFTPWAAELKRRIRSAAGTESLSIDWRFCAHHYANNLHNWKRSVSEGGGALRFFGIHLAALLAEIGFDTIVRSGASAIAPDECETWSAVFAGPGLPECRVHVQSNAAQRRFSIDWTGDGSVAERLADLGDPFEANADIPGFDHRAGILTDSCRDLIDGAAPSCSWYRQSIRLWDVAERLCSVDESTP
jgi:predicted dehydrogenase